MKTYNLIKIICRSLYSKKLISFILLVMCGVSLYMIDTVTTDYISRKYKVDYIESMFQEDANKINYVSYLNLMSPEYTFDKGKELIEYIRNQENVSICGRFCNTTAVGFLNGNNVDGVIIESDIVDIGNLKLSQEDKRKIRENVGQYNMVYIGSDYRDYYNIGDKFSLDNDSNINCVVAGYLESNASWPKKGKLFGGAIGSDSFNLNKNIVVIANNYDDINTLGGRPDTIYYLVENPENSSQIEVDIIKKASEQSLGVKVVNEGREIQQEKSDNNITDNKTFLAAILLSFLAIVSISASSIIFSLMRKHQYGILMTCGVSRKEIITMTFVENAFLMSIATVVVWIVRQKELFGKVIFSLSEATSLFIVYPYYYAHVICIPIIFILLIIFMVIITGLIPAVIIGNINTAEIIASND